MIKMTYSLRLSGAVILFLFLFFGSYSKAFSQIATAPTLGDGSPGNPYQIATLENLYWIAAADAVVASPNRATRWVAHYVQIANIDASSTSTWFSGEGWSPIGTSTNTAAFSATSSSNKPFTGTYNGGDYTISGLTINRPTMRYVGLFGLVSGGSASINRISLTNVSVIGFRYVGALIGLSLDAQISWISTSGSVSGVADFNSRDVGGIVGFMRGTTLSNSFSISSVLGGNGGFDGGFVGGIVGYMDAASSGVAGTSSISNSFTAGSVSSSSSFVGGIAGYFEQSVLSNSYSSSSVSGNSTVGGAIGGFRSGSSAINSYSVGLVSGNFTFGGFIGSFSSSGTTLTNSYYDSQTSGQSDTGKGEPKTTIEMKTQSTFTGWDFTAGTGDWNINPTGYTSYPYLQAFTYDVPEASPAVNPIPGLASLPIILLSSSSPSANANSIAANTNIALTFDTNLNASTVNSTNIVVRGQQSGSIAGAWSVNNAVATFDPTADLLAGEVIHVEISTNVQGSGGEVLNNSAALSFTVLPQPPFHGENWATASATEPNQWRSVTYGNGLFVAVSTTGTNRVMTSADGITWTARVASEASQWRSVTYGNGRFVAVASFSLAPDLRTMYSDDGINWTAATEAQVNSWRSVTYGNGRFVAVSSDGANRVMYSDDGITWTASSAAESNFWISITYGNGRFVAVSTDGVNRVMHSSDGINWTAASATENSQWLSVTYGNGLFVAVSSDAANRVMYSSDGISWNSASAAAANAWLSVIYGNGRFVAVAGSGTNRIMHSNDGTSWISATSPENNSWGSVTYGNGKFIAVASSGTSQVMYSTGTVIWAGTTDTDGETGANWTSGTAPPAGTDIQIPSGLTNYPVFDADFQSGDIDIQTGASLSMAPGFTLTFAAGKGATGDGKIILQSDATGDASIGDLTGAGAIGVEVVQERYVAGNNRAFRFMSHPFNAAMPLSVVAATIDITGDGGATNGFTTTDTNNPSAFRFDPTLADGAAGEDAGWVPFTNTSQTIGVAEAIRILVRGSKGQSGSLLDGAYTPDPVTFEFEGTINTGNVVKTLSASPPSDWNLVGNPYPSPINLQLLTTGAADNDVYIWDPRAAYTGSGSLISGAGRGGAYVTEEITGAGSFNLPAGSGFFIKALADANTITFAETMKVAGDPAGFESVLRQEEVASKYGANSIQIRLESEGQFFDRFIMRFRETTAAYHEPEDGAKLANPVVNFFPMSSDGYALAIDDRPYSEDDEASMIPVWIMSPPNSYTLHVPDYDLEAGRSLILYDRFTEESISLSKGESYSFEVTEDPKSRDHRFDLIMGGEVVTSLQNLQNELQVVLMPNPAEQQVAITFQRKDQWEATEIRIMDMQGRVLEQQSILPEEEARIDYELGSLGKGIYLVEVRQGMSREVKRLVVK